MISDRLTRYFRESESPVLLAGAGVSLRAGLPIWKQYLSEIAAQVGVYDNLTRQMIQQQVSSNLYEIAAEYLFLSPTIPEARKYEMLTEPLKEYSVSAILDLVKLPFKAIVTTNFDRVLLDAYAAAHLRAPKQVEAQDPSLRAAPFDDDFYIARIHGRIEAPETITLSQSQFKKLIADHSYANYVTYIITRCQLCFVGFSFLDPAIDHFLKVVKSNIGTQHKGKHIALLPETCDPSLAATLSEFNIEAIKYASDDNHRELWDAINAAVPAIESLEPAPTNLQQPHPFEHAQKYLASAYSRTKLGQASKPLRLAVLEGFIAQEICEAGTQGVTHAELVQAVRSSVRVSRNDAEEIVVVSVDRLRSESLCGFHDDDDRAYVWKGEKIVSIHEVLEPIVSEIMDRFVVRSGGADTEKFLGCLNSGLVALFVRRGWDLGAAFAAGRIPEMLQLGDLETNLRACPSVNALDAKGLLDAASDVLRNPNSSQSTALAAIGRLSFGLELVFQSPQDTLFHALTLPETIYLDANVLMPAIVPGHPYHEVYRNTIDRLHVASAEAMVQVQVVAYKGFLNEVISHRKLGIEEMREFPEDRAEALRKDAILYGSTSLNVFVAGYANTLKNERDLSFDGFLEKYAPYPDESSLERFLAKQNIVVRREPELLGEGSEFPKILHQMEVAFADAISRRHRTSLLVRHDAVQLAALTRDAERNRRSILVTADGRLREAVASSSYSRLGIAMVSHLGLIQLIDLLVGLDVEARGITSMMFFPKTSSQSDQIRQYLVSRALDSYDEAMAMEMHRLVDQYVEEIQARVPMQYADEPDHVYRAKVRRVIDGFEDQYFSEMRKRIEQARDS